MNQVFGNIPSFSPIFLNPNVNSVNHSRHCKAKLLHLQLLGIESDVVLLSTATAWGWSNALKERHPADVKTLWPRSMAQKSEIDELMIVVRRSLTILIP